MIQINFSCEYTYIMLSTNSNPSKSKQQETPNFSVFFTPNAQAFPDSNLYLWYNEYRASEPLLQAGENRYNRLLPIHQTERAGLERHEFDE